ncbi:MAG: N-6 DNA methylase, partial [Alphaproteobacteria bacterium]|nr:N-6 DNA methylase [Alphaproteobacteria bacterium]
MDISNEIISVKQVSDMLEISDATVRNWVKQGYLSVAENTKSKFHFSDVLSVKTKIERGEINRLRKRANKKSTDNSFVPDEYINDVSFVDEVEKIKKIFLLQGLDIETLTFVLTLKQLVLKKEVTLDNELDLFNFSDLSKWCRTSVKKEILSWHNKLKITKDIPINSYIEIFNLLKNTSQDDTIGIIYQSLMYEGSKSKKGSYYTPKGLINNIFNDFEKRDGKFLDPCCGTGQFLLCAANSGYKNPDLLYGFDIDDIAVKIARINLLLAFPDKEFNPKIYKANTLTEAVNHSFQLIATNPPWGASIEECTNRNIQALYPYIKSKESFSFFLAKSMELAEKGGRISFILPESILNIRVHSDIRRHILDNTAVKSIHCIGRKFKGVFTPVIRLDLSNTKPLEDGNIDVYLNEKQPHKIPQSRFLKNEHLIFNVYLSEEENQILSKLYSIPHVTLENKAEWALGIVTGDNEKYISSTKHEKMEAVFKGKDIEPYKLKTPSAFIEFNPKLFQQTAPKYKYRAKEKLIYKFISNKLVFAYDDKQSLTLNSANILIPKIEGYPIKVILALLNSKLYQFVFAKKFSTHKILKGDLEKLPLPLFANKVLQKIEQLAI